MRICEFVRIRYLYKSRGMVRIINQETYDKRCIVPSEQRIFNFAMAFYFISLYISDFCSVVYRELSSEQGRV